MRKFSLRLYSSGETYRQRHAFDFSSGDSLIRTEYLNKRLDIRNLKGVWKFIEWLPVEGSSDYSTQTIVYKSTELAGELGLKNLYIAFNGYYPEIKAEMKTYTFKELEAAVTLQYLRERERRTLVVASAGNTAKAFAYAASLEGIPIVVVSPLECLCDSSVPQLKEEYVRLVGVKDGDYSDAIKLAERISELPGYIYEGGARNFARRDALATVLLEAVLKMGKLPDAYFQAVGSGVGAIAVWEAAERLLENGAFGKKLPELHLSQNSTFSPMKSAWEEGRREIMPEKDFPQEKNILKIVYARVLSTKYPAYSIAGGVYDAMKSCGGSFYDVTEKEAIKAQKIFLEREGIDILPAAAIAVASLFKAVEEGKVRKEERILLNITGGGKERAQKELEQSEMKPCIVLSKDADNEELEEVLR